jgi:hypothetical protein
MLFLNKAPVALHDQPRAGLNVEGVLSDLLRDAQQFYRTPCKYVLVASEEVDELAFQFGIQASPYFDGLGRVFGVNLYNLSGLDRFESTR